MSVVVVNKTGIHEVVDGPRNWNMFTFTTEENGHYLAILIKCDEADGNFYSTIMREFSCDLGRLKRFLQYLSRRGLDTVCVFLMPDGEREIMYHGPDGSHLISNDATIVRVDSSIDPEVVQRAMDKDKWHCEQNEQPYYIKSTIDALLANGLLSGTYTITNF